MPRQLDIITGEGTSVDELSALRTAFEAKWIRANKGLDEFEFITETSRCLGRNFDHKAMRILFLQIDANEDKTVTWEEFTDFLLLENQRNLNVIRDARHHVLAEPFETSTSARSHGHRSSITSMISVEQQLEYKSYATSGDDGTVRLWRSNDCFYIAGICNNCFKFIELCECHLSERHAVTSMTLLPGVSKQHSKSGVKIAPAIAVAGVDHCINVYDSITMNITSRIGGKKSMLPGRRDDRSVVLSMDGVQLTRSVDDECRRLLCWGDSSGRLALWRLAHDWHVCDGSLSCHESPALTGDAHPFIVDSLHSDWITKVKYVSTIASVVTSSLDSKLKLFDVNHERVSFEYNEHTKGVQTFDWCDPYKLIASAGASRDIHVWQPHNPRTLATLVGHHASILKVLIDDETMQLTSLSADKEIKVWDLRTMRNIQTTKDTTFYTPKDIIETMMHDDTDNSIVTASSYPTKWPLSRNLMPTAGRSHAYPVVGMCYNNSFKQVVSCDTEGTVHLWDVSSGKLLFRFDDAHKGKKVTSTSLDARGRRLLTGSEDGTVKMWNFNSGQCLKEYEKKEVLSPPLSDRFEITGIINFQMGSAAAPGGSKGRLNFLAACAADKRIHVWPESIKDAHNISSHFMPNEAASPSDTSHEGDVHCIAFCPPSTIASGGSEGTIVLWNAENGKKIGTLRPPGAPVIPLDTATPVKSSRKESSTLQTLLGGQKRPSTPNASGASGRKQRLLSRIPTMDSTAMNSREARGNRGSSTWIPNSSFRNKYKSMSTVTSQVAIQSLREANFSVDALEWIPRCQCLVSFGGDGYIRIWSLEHRVQVAAFTREHGLGIDIMCASVLEANALIRVHPMIITGDADGHVTIYDSGSLTAPYIAQQARDMTTPVRPATGLRGSGFERTGFAGSGISRSPKPSPRSKADGLRTPIKELINELSTWRAHAMGIRCVSFVNLGDGMVVTCANDGIVAMWRLDGVQIGVFGQGKPWDIEVESSWRKGGCIAIASKSGLSDVDPLRPIILDGEEDSAVVAHTKAVEADPKKGINYILSRVDSSRAAGLEGETVGKTEEMVTVATVTESSAMNILSSKKTVRLVEPPTRAAKAAETHPTGQAVNKSARSLAVSLTEETLGEVMYEKKIMDLYSSGLAPKSEAKDEEDGEGDDTHGRVALVEEVVVPKSVGERIVENGGTIRLKRLGSKMSSGSIFAKDRGKQKLDLQHLLTNKKKGANRFRTVARVFIMNRALHTTTKQQNAVKRHNTNKRISAEKDFRDDDPTADEILARLDGGDTMKTKGRRFGTGQLNMSESSVVDPSDYSQAGITGTVASIKESAVEVDGDDIAVLEGDEYEGSDDDKAAEPGPWISKTSRNVTAVRPVDASGPLAAVGEGREVVTNLASKPVVPVVSSLARPVTSDLLLHARITRTVVKLHQLEVRKITAIPKDVNKIKHQPIRNATMQPVHTEEEEEFRDIKLYQKIL